MDVMKRGVFVCIPRNPTENEKHWVGVNDTDVPLFGYGATRKLNYLKLNE